MPPVIWGQTGDGVTPSTFPLLVAPNANGKSKALVLPGVAGNYASSPDVNLLDADTAHRMVGWGWSGTQIKSATDPAPSASGSGFDELINDTSLLGVEWTGTGVSEQVNSPNNNSSLNATAGEAYSAGVWVYLDAVDESSRTFTAGIRWYDQTPTYQSNGNIQARVVPHGQWTYLTLAEGITAPSYAGGTRANFHMELNGNQQVGDKLYVGAACLREGSDATFIPSTRITGDIDIRAHVQPQQWASGAAQLLTGKWEAASSDRSYNLSVGATGTLILQWSDDGVVTSTFRESTVVVPFTNSEGGWVRATLDSDNGASGHDVKFYTSTDGASWTQLGTTVTTAGVQSIYASPAPLCAGAINAGALWPLHGAILHAEVRDGIDGPVVAEFDADDLEAGNENLLDADTATLANSAGAWNDALADVTYFPGYLETSGDGTNRQLFVIKAGGSGIPVSASTTYYFSADVWTDSANALTSAFRATMYNGGSIVGGSLRGTGGGTSLVQNQWTRITGSITMEATVTNLQLDVVGDTAADANGETFRLRNVRMSTEAHTDFVYPNGSGLSSETGNVIATYRTGDATAECVDRACWQFTGSEYLEIADRDALNFGTGDFTIAAETHSRASSALLHALVSKRDSSSPNTGYELFTSTTKISSFVVDGGASQDSVSSGEARDGVWRVLTGMRDATNVLIANNNVEETVANTSVNTDLAQSLYVGRRDSGTNITYGLISWVAIWPRALTATERTELAAWDGRPGSSAPGSLYGTVLYLNAADTPTQTAHANAEVNNSLSSLVHPNMGSAARRARQREVGANAGSRLWDTTIDADGNAIPDADEFHPRYLDGKAWWFEAGSVQANDGDAVSVWRDISGNGRDASQATGDSQPTLVANGLNGRAVVRFDGVDDKLLTDAITPIAQPNTAFVVASVDTPGTGNNFIFDGVTGDRQAIWTQAGNWASFAGNNLGSATAADTSAHTLLAVFDGGSSTLHLDGVSISSGNAGANPIAGLKLGSWFTNDTNALDGDIAEVIVFDRTLTTAEMNGVGNYLASKYGLTWTEIA